jgi:hypothetical protein
MITVKHTNIKVDEKEYNIYEEADKSVTITSSTSGETINIATTCLNQLVTALGNVEKCQNYYDW